MSIRTSPKFPTVVFGLIAALTISVFSVVAVPARPAGAVVTDGYVPWSSVLPGWQDAYDPGSSNYCVSGNNKCLATTLAEMLRILNQTGKSCAHTAVFSMAYARMTQTYGYTRAQKGYYRDVPYMNHMDAVFGKAYTDAYYNFKAGKLSAVPSAWQTAFTAAAAGTVTGAGDLFLGMNAHINRDLPYVLWQSGLVETDGTTSGKADYDVVERWLYDDTAPLLDEAAARFDSSINSTNNPTVNAVFFQAISGWRENAWRNAEALASAPDDAARSVVEANINAYADATAASFLTTFAVNPTTESNATRDAYCAAHKNTTAPTRYPMGVPSPWGTTIAK